METLFIGHSLIPCCSTSMLVLFSNNLAGSLSGFFSSPCSLPDETSQAIDPGSVETFYGPLLGPKQLAQSTSGPFAGRSCWYFHNKGNHKLACMSEAHAGFHVCGCAYFLNVRFSGCFTRKPKGRPKPWSSLDLFCFARKPAAMSRIDRLQAFCEVKDRGHGEEIA